MAERSVAEPALPRVQVIGLTGGIASGKSEVQRCLQALGVRVLDADAVARELVDPGQPALAEITDRFGLSVLDQEGRLDRRALRARVFADPGERRALEAILHPRVREVLRERASTGDDRGYVVLAIPLLVESGRYDWIDRVLVVDATVELQRARVMARDGIDRDQAERMLAAQASRVERLAAADDVIVNDGSLADLRAAAERLHRFYSAMTPAETTSPSAN